MGIGGRCPGVICPGGNYHRENCPGAIIWGQFSKVGIVRWAIVLVGNCPGNVIPKVNVQGKKKLDSHEKVKRTIYQKFGLVHCRLQSVSQVIF